VIPHAACRWLALAYLFFSVSLALTIVFIPFVPQAFKLSM